MIHNANNIRPNNDGVKVEGHQEFCASASTLLTALYEHPATLSWLSAVLGHSIVPLGVDYSGQSGSVADIYEACGIDANALIDAVAEVMLRPF